MCTCKGLGPFRKEILFNVTLLLHIIVYRIANHYPIQSNYPIQSLSATQELSQIRWETSLTGKAAQQEISAAGSGLLGKEVVEHARHLQQAVVLAQVVLWLGQETVLPSIAAHEAHL